MSNLTFSSPDLSSFCQLNNLGLVATGQHLCAERAVIECRFTKAPEPCPKCGAAGVSRGTVDRHLAHTPYGQRPTTLLLRIRRWRCICGCFWHEDTSSAAPPRSKLSYGAMRWALATIVLDDLSISRIANHLGVAWHTVNSAILKEGKRLLFNDPKRFDGVTVLGVDEHVWRPVTVKVSVAFEFFYAAFFIPSASFLCSGFKVTSVILFQFRVWPLQRSGLAVRAA